MVLDNINEKMAKAIKENEKIIKCMVKERCFIKIKKNTLGNFIKINGKEKANSTSKHYL